MNLETLCKISYGMYIICSKMGEKYNGQIANTVCQITAEPPTIAVSICKQNLTHSYIQQSKVFTVSILDQETPMKFIGLFGFRSGRDINKFENANYKIGKTEAPIVLDNTLGYIETEVIDSIDVGTHTIFVGKVVETEDIKDGEPLTYQYYRIIKSGKSPKTAPTYIKTERKKEGKVMDKYECTVCGYIYDPEKGDPDGGIAPGTAFADIPDDWVCPVCGVGKDQFKKVE